VKKAVPTEELSGTGTPTEHLPPPLDGPRRPVEAHLPCFQEDWESQDQWCLLEDETALYVFAIAKTMSVPLRYRHSLALKQVGF